MIDGGSVPIGFFKYIFFIFKKFLTRPKESYYISKNILRGFWRYYVQKDKKYNQKDFPDACIGWSEI